MPSRLPFFLHAASLALAASDVPPTHVLERFTADLDATPEQQWAPIWEKVLDKKGTDAFEATYKAWLEGLAILLPEEYNGTERARASGQKFVEALERGHPQALAELKALSKALLRRKTTSVFELPLLSSAIAGYVLGTTSLKATTDTRPHEASACTSTLVMGDDGTVLHGRSLDYEPRDPVAETAIQVDFVRGGEVQYSCLHPLAWTTALQWYTCVRPQGFSLSVNARSQGVSTEHNTSFAELLSRVENPGALLLGEMGAAAMNASTYAQAVDVLSSTRVVSSNYFIIADGSSTSGSIITRYGNRSLDADIWRLGSGQQDGQPAWMRVQTNVDHNVSLESGAYATHRRQHMIKLLQYYQNVDIQAVSQSSLWQIYFTDRALDLDSMKNRREPEDTGVILRPTTIATAVLRPSQAASGDASLPVHVWAATPEIRPPLDGEEVVV